MELIGEALRTITVSDAEGYFEHCGYRRVVKLYDRRSSGSLLLVDIEIETFSAAHSLKQPS